MHFRVGGRVIHCPPTNRRGGLYTNVLVLVAVIVVVYMLVSMSNVDLEESPTLHHEPHQLNGPIVSEDTEHQSENVILRGPILLAPAAKPVVRQMRMAMDGALVKPGVIRQVLRRVLDEQERPPDKIYNINITYSDVISMDRVIPDTRPPVCLEKHYDIASFPRVSVVIPFYNEAFSMLIRTVHSILNRSPDRLLAEVILVDDRSTHEYLKEPLDRYMRLLPKVQILRNKDREGLIRSRLAGFDLATGSVVVFLDAHTECNQGWLEPLLYELQLHPHSVIQPFVDGIDAWSIDYTSPPTIYKGAFSWDLRYTWLRVSDHASDQVREYGIPFFSPTLVGCALAVNKDYFTTIGLFDEGLNVWGGENIELAWRVWMCGGTVTTVPCSRVGHVFKNFPYKFDGDREDIVQKNLMRLAETWMDGYKKYFYASTRIYDFKRAEFTDEEKKSVQKRIDLRKQLKCKSFDWYMYNLLPEMEPPPMDSVYYGEVMNLRSRACFEVRQSGFVGLTYACFEHKIIPKNNFRLNINGLLQYKDKCVTFDDPTPALYIAECPYEDFENFGIWKLKNKGHVWGTLHVSKRNKQGVMRHWCITQVTNVLHDHFHEQMPQITECGEGTESNDFEVWIWTYKFDYNV